MSETVEPKPKHYAHFLLMSQYYALNQACVPLWKEFTFDGRWGIYMVGSVLARKDWRDVDIRCILDADKYAILGKPFLHAAISEWISARTGLPIDFQFQEINEANEKFPGLRNAIGIRDE